MYNIKLVVSHICYKQRNGERRNEDGWHESSKKKKEKAQKARYFVVNFE